MKKGYDIILSLRYITTIKIETAKEDEEEIKEDAKQCFIQDVLDVSGARDLLELTKAVKIERNYIEESEFQKWREESKKNYRVNFFARMSDLFVIVSAVDETEAEEKAEEEITVEFTSEDGKTVCNVEKYIYEGTEEVNYEKED